MKQWRVFTRQRMIKEVNKNNQLILFRILQETFVFKDYPIAKYRPLMVASVDSSIDAPITPAKTELRNGYRDPIRFRHCPVEIPHIETSKPVDFSRGEF